MKLVCSSTEDYLEKIRPFLKTVNAFFPGDVYLITVACEVPAGYLDELPKVQALTISHEQNDGAPEGTNSVQHGSFLRVLPGVQDDDLIIYSDGDIILQRPFTTEEMGWLEAWEDNEVGVAWNSGPNEKLIDEARRLHPKVDEKLLANFWGEQIYREPCFNIGVTVARAKTWRRLYSAYMQDWQKACDTLAHRARQQWLVCYEIAAQGYSSIVLPFTFHTHQHYGLPFGVWMSDGVAWYANEPIAFRHRF